MRNSIRLRHQRKGVVVARALPAPRQYMFMDAIQTMAERYGTGVTVGFYLAISAAFVVLAAGMPGLGYQSALVLAVVASVIFRGSVGQRRSPAKE